MRRHFNLTLTYELGIAGITLYFNLHSQFGLEQTICLPRFLGLRWCANLHQHRANVVVQVTTRFVFAASTFRARINHLAAPTLMV